MNGAAEERAIDEYVSKSIAPATGATYRKAFESWANYAREKEWPPLPAEANHFAAFLAAQGQAGATAAQVTTWVAAVAHKHAEACLTSPTTHPTVKKVVTGIKRDTAKPCIPRKPMSYGILRDLGRIVRASGLLQDWRTYWRINMQFYGLLRWEETSKLTTADIAFTTQHMEINIKRSKTDQLKHGAQVRIARQTDAPDQCPVNITHVYMRMLRGDREDTVQLQPRVAWKEGQQRAIEGTTVSYSTALQDLKELISKTGRNGEEFGEHSGRRGGATAAAEAGVQWTDLKKHGRWSSDSAPQRYTENTQKRRSAVALALARAAVTDARACHRRPMGEQATGRITEEGTGTSLPGPTVVLPPATGPSGPEAAGPKISFA